MEFLFLISSKMDLQRLKQFGGKKVEELTQNEIKILEKQRCKEVKTEKEKIKKDFKDKVKKVPLLDAKEFCFVRNIGHVKRIISLDKEKLRSYLFSQYGVEKFKNRINHFTGKIEIYI